MDTVFSNCVELFLVEMKKIQLFLVCEKRLVTANSKQKNNKNK